jgi:hypothetical protein
VPYPSFSLSARGVLEKVLVYFTGFTEASSFLAAKFFVLADRFYCFQVYSSERGSRKANACGRLCTGYPYSLATSRCPTYPRSPASCALAKPPKDAAENYQFGASSHEAETDALPPKL